MIDGRSRGYVIESCTSDIVMLRATLRSAQAHVLSFDPGTNILEVNMSRLRAKLDRGFGQPLIETVKGQGYRFVTPPEIAQGCQNFARAQVTAALVRVG